ncbi:hypothetical protein HDU96_010782, partial [Phlyctochytrium bullatum]
MAFAAPVDPSAVMMSHAAGSPKIVRSHTSSPSSPPVTPDGGGPTPTPNVPHGIHHHHHYPQQQHHNPYFGGSSQPVPENRTSPPAMAGLKRKASTTSSVGGPVAAVPSVVAIPAPPVAHGAVAVKPTGGGAREKERGVACAVCRSRKVKCDGTQTRCLKKPGSANAVRVPHAKTEMMVNSPLFPAFLKAWEESSESTHLMMMDFSMRRYKDPVHIGDSSNLWIDRAVVEKFSARPEMFPFEVVDRQRFLANFESQPPELRAAMCALSAQLSMPRAPEGVVQRYYAEGRRLCFSDLETPSVSTIQALLTLALTSVATGKVVVGIQFLSMASRMLDALKISLKGVGNESGLQLANSMLAENFRLIAVCFLFDRVSATITGRQTHMNVDLSYFQEICLQDPDTQASFQSTLRQIHSAVELADLLYTIKQEADLPLTTVQDFYDRKERFLIIESKLEDWRAFVPAVLNFDRIMETGIDEEAVFQQYGLAQMFFFAIYHLCVCLLHRPRIRLKRMLAVQHPAVANDRDHDINRRLVASCNKAYASARTLQYLLLIFRLHQVTPFENDPIMGFCILVSSLVFVELILVTDLDILDEGVKTLKDDVEVFGAISQYLNLDPCWMRGLREIVAENDCSPEGFERLLRHLEAEHPVTALRVLGGNDAGVAPTTTTGAEQPQFAAVLVPLAMLQGENAGRGVRLVLDAPPPVSVDATAQPSDTSSMMVPLVITTMPSSHPFQPAPTGQPPSAFQPAPPSAFLGGDLIDWGTLSTKSPRPSPTPSTGATPAPTPAPTSVSPPPPATTTRRRVASAPNPDAPLRCPDCHQTFSRLHGLLRHMRTAHTAERAHGCE